MASSNNQTMKEHGRNLMIQGNYKDASKEFKEFLKKKPDDMEIQYLYTATKELKQPTKSIINFISVIGLDIYLHMGVTAPLGSTLIDALRKTREACKEAEERIAKRFLVSKDGEKIGEGFLVNWHILDFKTIKIDMMTRSTKPERYVLRNIDKEEHKTYFSIPPISFLENEPTDFEVQFKESFSDPPLDKIGFKPEDSLNSVLGQYNTIVLRGPNVAPVWNDVAMTIPNSVPELDIFFQRGRGPSDTNIEEMTDLLLKHPPEGMPPNLSREEAKRYVKHVEIKRWMSTRNIETEPVKKMETKQKTSRDCCPDCNAKFTEKDIRQDGYVICKTCRKRFKP
ncbi:MAG: hypothetical protein ACTSWQ_08355 [Candidatus Thorarchaeota archaeon]